MKVRVLPPKQTQSMDPQMQGGQMGGQMGGGQMGPPMGGAPQMRAGPAPYGQPGMGQPYGQSPQPYGQPQMAPQSPFGAYRGAQNYGYAQNQVKG